MIEKAGANIVFLIWALLNITFSFIAFKIFKRWAFVGMVAGTVFAGYLLYTQNWTGYLYYGLIVWTIFPLLQPEKEQFREKLTIPRFTCLLAIAYTIGFGTYGIIFLLNK
jgi:putative Mn2+ efflux pump MntP